MKLFIALIVFSLSFIHQNVYADNWVQQRLDELNLLDIELAKFIDRKISIDDLSLTILVATMQNSNSATQMWLPIKKELNQYLKKASYTEKDAEDLVFGSSAWYKIYWGFLRLLSDREVYNDRLESDAVGNKLKNTHNDAFIKWVHDLSKSSAKAIELGESSDKNSWYLPGILTWKPETCKKMAEFYGNDIVYFNLSWLRTITDYIEIQSIYFENLSILESIIAKAESDYNRGITGDTNIIHKIKEIKKINTILYKTIDPLVREYLFDNPIVYLSLYTLLKFESFKVGLFNDETKMNRVFKDFALIKEIGYMANPTNVSTVLNNYKLMKGNYNEKEMGDLRAEVALTPDWAGVPQQLKLRSIENPLTK